MVVLGQKGLYWGRNGCIRAKLLCSGKSGFIQAIADVFGKAVVLRQKLLYSSKNGCIRTKFALFGQNGCIRQKWLYSFKVVVFGQGGYIR